jgi:hypothetical protein
MSLDPGVGLGQVSSIASRPVRFGFVASQDVVLIYRAGHRKRRDLVTTAVSRRVLSGTMRRNAAQCNEGKDDEGTNSVRLVVLGFGTRGG